MNKIFKVVWNRTIGSFVVTSELAKGRVKSSSEGAEGDVRASEEGRLKTLFRLTALSAALFGLSESAWAHPIINSTAPANTTGIVATGNASETAVGGGSARGVGSVAVGAFAKAGTRIEADGAVAIGGSQASTGAFADGNNAIAIGQASNANAAKAISIGSDTIASHEWTSAYGGRAEAKNVGATALGSWTQANGEFSIAVGGSDRFGGERSTGTIASGDRSTAIGRIARSAGADAIALGTGAQATLTNSIAIGKNSVATGVNNIAKNPVNVGNAVAIGPGVQALGEDSVAIGVSAGANLTQATTKQSLAIGWTAKATGTAQAVAIGPDAIASGAQSTSIGNNTRATGDSSIAIGGDDWNIVREKTVAAAGNKQVHQIYQDLTGVEMKKQGQAYGNPFKGTTAGDAAVAVGVTALAEGVLSTAFGSGTSASGIGAAAFGVGASASQDKSVAIGAGSRTNTDATAVTTATVNGITYSGFAGTEHITPGSQVSFGSAGYERQLKHVAPGAITATSTDAINGSQLYALHAGSGNIAKAVADALGGGAAVGIDPTNNQGTVTLPSYDVLKGSDTPNTAGNGTAKFNTTPAKNVAAAMTNLNTYVNQGFAVKDNAGDAKGIVTPGESVQFADGNATTVTVDTEADGNTKIKYDVKVDDKTIKVVDGKLTGASQTHFYSVKNEDQTKGNYNNDGATGENAIAAGPEAKAAASNAVVMGNKATVEAAAGSDSAINGETTGEGSVAVGALSKANGKNATAIGQKANAYGQNSFAGGQDTESSGKSSVAIGDGSRATDNSTTAVGPYAKAQKAGASAFGFNANAQAIGSVAVGRQAQALNLNAVSVGNESKAKGEDTVAIGTSADAVQNRAMAIGKGAVANGADTIAFGAATKADQRYAIAIGSGNNAWKEDSVALGRAANANGAASLALGLSSHTREANAIALGNNANADDTNSIAIGTNSKAAQAAAVAIGNNATALKYSSIVIGEEAKSNNSRSVVIGYYASATNPAMSASNQDTNQTVAIGAYANAWGDQSTAIGNNVDAKGNSSIAIGADDWDTVAVKTVEGTGKTVKEVYQDYTGDVMETGSYTHTTSSEAAVAIGTKSQAIGQLSTAFGTGTIAEGVASAAFGMGAKATQGNSVAIGAGSTTASGAIGVNEATVNNLKYSGFAGGNNVNPGDQVSFGSKNYERQLKNVAPGEISNTSTDAINGSQLYAVQNVLGNTAQTVKNVLGGDAAVDENGSITMSNIGNTGKGNIHDAIKSVKETADKGWKLKANDEADSDSEKIAAGDTVTVKQGKNIRVKRSGKDLTIETADDVAFNKVTVGNSVLTTDGLNTPQVTAGDSVLGNNGLTIANGANPVSLTKSGLDNGGNKVTNIADGVADTDAASYKQVKAAKTEVQKGTNVVSVDKTEGTDGHAIYTVNAKGTAVSAEGTENGLKLTSSEDSTTNVTTYNLDLSDKTKDSLKKADSALQGIDVKVNDENVKTLTKDDSTLKFVNGTGTTAENKGGTVTFNVNKSTLTTGAGGVVSADTAGDAFATAADVAKAINKAVVDSEKTSVVAAGDNTHVAAVEAGNQTTYTVHADNTTVSVKDGGKLALKSSEATNSNHTKTTNYELDLSDDAKAEIQKGVDAKNIVDTKGITFNGDSGSPVTKKLDETLAIKGDDKNVVTESGADGIKVKLKDEITVQTVNADKLKAGDSVLTNDGLNIANGNNPVSLTKSGLNNGGNKITKVAKGENEDDAVNYAQLKELAEKGLTFDADGNTSTSSKKLGERVGIKGGNNITTSADSDNVTVKLNDDITLNSVTATTLKAGDSTLTNAGLVTPKVTAGDSVLTTDGLNIANGTAGSPVSLTKDGLNNGGNKVTDVAKGTADTDAVNFSQLNPIAKALNTTVNPDGSIAAPNFTVKHADGTEGTPVHTVQDALDKVGEEVTKGINVGGTTGSNKYALGGTINIKGDSNIVSDTVEGGVQLKLADTVKIGQDSGKPVSIDGTAGTVSGLSNTTLGNTPLAGSNKAATEAQLDATQVNLKNILGGEAKNENGNVSTEDIGGTGENTIHDAIKSVKATADKGWKLKANDEADSDSEKIAAGDTVTVKQGKNIRVKRSGKDLTIETADDVAFNKVTVGNSVLTTDGLNTPQVTAGDSVLGNNGLTIANGANPVSLTKSGLDNGGNKVTNIADGVADTDAASYKQVKAAKTEVQKGTNVVSVDKTEGTDGHAIYTVNAKGTAVSAEGTENGLKLTSSEDSTTNVTTYNLDLSDKTKDSLKKADSALQGIDVKVNDENVKTLTKDDSTLKFVNGTGTTAENKGGTVTFNVNKSTLTTGAGGVVSADTAGDAFATAADVAKAINKAVVDSEKTSVVAAGDNTHVAAVEAGNQTTYTVHADNTTVSVKDGGKLALKSSEATNSNHTKTTNYELDLSDDAKAEIQKGVDAKNIVDTKGITFNGDSGSPVTKKLDETLAIKGDDKNVVTESGADGIKVKLKDEITVQTVNADKLKAGDSVLTNDGLNIANGNNPVSLTKSGLNNGGNKITKVAKGENEDDAVNYAQLKELAEKGLTFDADGNTSTSSKKLGERVGIKGGNNITTSADSDNVTVKLNDDITLNSVTATTLKAGDSTLTNAGLVTPKVTAGDSVLTTDGLNIANGTAGSPVSLTKDGLNNGGNKVTDVAKGTADTDGVNVSQLNPVAKALNTNIDPTTGEVAAPSFTVTKADGTKHPAVGTVQDALDKVGEEVTKGLNIVADNGSSEKVNLGDTVKYTSKDKNIVTTSGTGKAIDFSLAEKVTIGKDAANGGKPVVIDGKEGIVSGLTNTTLGAAPLAGSNKAATEAQLDATQVNLANVLGGNAANNNGNVTTSDIGGTGEDNIHDAIKSVKATADKGWNLNANDETSSEKIAAGDTVTFKEGKNVKVSRNGKSITIATSDDVSFKTVTVGDSVLTDNGLTVGNGKAGKPVSLTKDGLNNGGNKIANVAAGEADTDAVNVAQLKAAAAKATSKVESGNDNIVVAPEQNADGSTTYKVATAPNLKADSFTAGDTVVNKDGVKVGDKVALGRDGLKAGDVNITADGINAGNKAISNVAEGKKDTDAVNVAQLKAAAAKATSKVESGNDNIVVTPEQNADGSTTYKVATAPDLKADSLTTGDTVVNNDGVKVGDKVALTKDGLDNGGNKVANVAAGEADTDAVNVAQLKAAAAKATSKVESGNDNIVVTPEQNADGSTTYKVATAPDLKADSLTTGDTVVNNDGVKVGDKVALGKDGLKAGDVNITADGINAGGKKVTGVAAGTVAAGSTDAVNGSQLYQANQAINQSMTNLGNYVVNMGNQINQRIDNVESDSKAGTAAAMAVAGLPQAYLPGKSMMAVAGGVYRGESGYAVGFSSISDGGNWIIKGTATGNSRGHYGATAGVGYQW